MATTKKWTILAMAFVSIFMANLAVAQTPSTSSEHKSRFSIDAMFDVGTSVTSPEPVLQKNWQQLFAPPSDGMKASVTTHPLTSMFKMGITGKLSGNSRSWQVRLPVSYQLIGLNFNRIHPKFYLFKNGVAGTTVNWWDTVMVNDIVVEHLTPRIGIEFRRGNRSIAVSIQHYRLMARDYVGKDCVNCQNSSKVTNTMQLDSGISPRLDVFFGPRCGLFVESAGSKAISFGLTSRWENER